LTSTKFGSNQRFFILDINLHFYLRQLWKTE